MIKKLHHIGIVVSDVDRVAQNYSALLGLEVSHLEETRGKSALRIAFIPVDNVFIELIQPLTDRGPNAEFLRNHGEGIHHIALQVEDVSEGLNDLRQQGVATQHDRPVIGAGGCRIAFINANDFGGCLIELSEVIGVDQQ